MSGRLLIALLSVLPRHALSTAAGRLAGVPLPRSWRAPVHRAYCRAVGADPAEAALPLAEYRTLNAFFTRELRPGLRPVAADCLTSPVDGTVGAQGTVTDGTLVQAKGRTYSLDALLADPELARGFAGGSYATLYLSPKDYHRIHAPAAGRISRATHVPGELWPVNAAAVAHVADLFAVNERIVVVLERATGGRIALVMVGATMVGMTRLAFDDLHTHVRRGRLQRRSYDPAVEVGAGEQIAHFEFGSTVVVVCSPDAGPVDPREVGSTLRVGQRLGA